MTWAAVRFWLVYCRISSASRSEKDWLPDDVVLGDLAHLLLDEAAQRLDRQMRIALLAHPLDELVV